MTELETILNLGFDRSKVLRKVISLRCSQCEAVFINKVPCHEHGCPNRTWECAECEGGRVARKGMTCDGCIDAQVSLDEQNVEDGQARWAETGSTRQY